MISKISEPSKAILNREITKLRSERQNLQRHAETIKAQHESLIKKIAAIDNKIGKIGTDLDASRS